LVPDERISLNEIRRISVLLYGIGTWGALFTPRQLLALTTLARLVREVGSRVDSSHRDAVQTCLALAVDRQAQATSSLCRWDVTGEKNTGTFSRQALPMGWDFSEVSPLSESTGGFKGAIQWIVDVCEANVDSAASGGTVEQADAAQH